MALIRCKYARRLREHTEGQTAHVTWSSMVEERQGQSTLEYALVLGAFLCLMAALALLWKLGAQGQLQKLAEEAASHIIGSLSGIRDIVLF